MLRVAVIGLGAMGRRHVEAFRSVVGCTLVIGHDLDEEARVRAERDLALPCTAHLEQAIEAADLVVVATPSPTHAGVAERVLASSRHLLVEKPLAATAEEAEALVSAAARRRVQVLVGMSERFNPVVRWLARHVVPADLRSMTLERHGPPPPSIRATPVDIVTELAIHDLDLIAHLSGSALMHVSGRVDDDEAASLEIVTTSSVKARVAVSWRSALRRRSLSLDTKSARYDADLLTGRIAVSGAEEPRVVVVDEGEQPLRAQAAAVVAHLLGDGSSFVSTGADGARLLETIENGDVSRLAPHRPRTPSHRHMPIEIP